VHRQGEGQGAVRVRLQGVGGDPGQQTQKPALAKAGGGQFVLHAKALHDNPFDGHSLGPVIAELEALTGVATSRIHVDKGYRGHTHAQKFRVWPDGLQLPQRRRRRPHQCRPRRCRLQLQPAPALARAVFARLDADAARHPSTSPKRLTNAPHRFFTDDHVHARKACADYSGDRLTLLLLVLLAVRS